VRAKPVDNEVEEVIVSFGPVPEIARPVKIFRSFLSACSLQPASCGRTIQ
jgi:hypothetical protein